MKKTVFITVLAAVLLVGFHSYGQELMPQQGSNGKYGYVDAETDKVVIPFKYEAANIFSEELAAVAVMDGNLEKYGYIDKTGKTVIPFKYNHATNFSEGLATVIVVMKEQNDFVAKWGYIDKTGKTVIPFKYSLAQPFSNGLAAVVTAGIKGKWGYINKIGEEVIPCKYDLPSDFNEGLAAVQLNNKWGFVDETGKEIIPLNYQAVGSFEGGLALVQLRNKFGYIDKTGEVVIPCEYNDATTAYRQMLKLDQTAINVTLSTDSAPKSNQTTSAENMNTGGSSGVSASNQPASTVNMSIGKSDVAVNIPTTDVKNDKIFAVIIANENYQSEARVDFAQNDGETFKKYCIQTLGLPEKNVHFIADATLNNMRREINWISQVASAFKGEASIIFYYAGHGIPDESSKTAYLLPVDGYGSDVQTGYKLDDLYQTMGKMPAKSITILMDACFSGAQRSSNGDMLASARGVAIKVTQGAPVGNMVVFSAAQGDETAYPYKEKGHGMFTYFLLKKLQETKGDVTLGELGDYITTNVQQQSIVVNNKSQTPAVMPSATIGDKWKGLKLK